MNNATRVRGAFAVQIDDPNWNAAVSGPGPGGCDAAIADADGASSAFWTLRDGVRERLPLRVFAADNGRLRRLEGLLYEDLRDRLNQLGGRDVRDAGTVR